MPFTNEHGGECCGRYQIFDFPHGYQRVTQKTISSVKEILNSYNDEAEVEGEEKDSYRCAEICLTEAQSGKRYENKTLKSYLEDMGFEVVYKFRNPNTNNIVSVFMYSENKV